MDTTRSLLAALAASSLLCAVPACHDRPSSGRTMVLALDGLDPDTVDLLVSEGKMPNFAALREEGAYGRLSSPPPLLSPVLWTTIATGKTLDEHGIGHFVAIDEASGQVIPVTSAMRRVKAVWNIFSDAGRTVGVVGWWATWPAEQVNGNLLSDRACYHFLFDDAAKGPEDTTRLSYPPELYDRVVAWILRPDDLTAADVSPFVHVETRELEKPFSFDDDLSHFKWALATARSYGRIGLEIWREDRPDLLMTYIEATDSTSHLFGHLFRAEGLSGELAEQQMRFGDAVEQMYLYADRIVGDYRRAMTDDTTLVVLSDHGFQLGALHDDPSKTRDLRRVSEQFHREEGLLYLFGARVKSGTRLREPRLVDVTPTLLALSGLAPASDMPGRVLAEGLDIAPTVARVGTYENESSDPRSEADGRDSRVDPKILERLESLGYLDHTVSPEGDDNLAKMLFESGRYEDAAEAFARLVAASPEDARRRTSLAGALGALGRYEEAIGHLDVALALDPLRPETHHNRAVIYERQGNVNAAIEEYRTALRYAPSYDPARQALLRLTGSAQLWEPRNADEARAARFAEEASQVARRGDYSSAMELLKEAERIAPDFVLVYQYQSNVAYLAGDVDSAIRALEKALALQPDNVLFETNLRRLRDALARTGR